MNSYIPTRNVFKLETVNEYDRIDAVYFVIYKLEFTTENSCIPSFKNSNYQKGKKRKRTCQEPGLAYTYGPSNASKK